MIYIFFKKNIKMEILENLNNLKKFIKQFNEDEKEIIGIDFTSCWLYAYYVHKLFNLEIDNYECVYKNEIKDEKELSLIFEKDEKKIIYSFFIEHDEEFHHFVIYKNENNYDLYQTYGGIRKIMRLKINKDIFIKNMESLLFFENNKINIYKTLFNLKNLNYKKINNIKLKYTYKIL